MEDEEIIVEDSELKKPKEIQVLIGEYLVQLWKDFKPAIGTNELCIGTLYGFNCYIERTSKDTEEMSSLHGSNALVTNRYFARHPEGGMKYLFNNGLPNRENYKMCSKLFLNSCERVEKVLNQYTSEQQNLSVAIQQLSTIQVKPFAKDQEVIELREESKRLSKQIDEKLKEGNKVTEKVEI